MISSSGRYLGGLKKWVPSQCRRKSPLRPSARPVIESPDVLELTIDPSRRSASTRSRSDRFASARSMMASTIQSVCAIHARSESKPPVLMRATASAEKNGSGLSCRARSSPSRAACGRYVEEDDRVSGVTQMCGDLRAHGSGAEDGDGSYSTRRRRHFRHVTLSSLPLNWRSSPWYDDSRSRWRRAVLVFQLIAAGQTRATTADLGGTIVDQSSSVLPGATVTAQNIETNHARSAMTDEQGHFLIPALPPGTYTRTR